MRHWIVPLMATLLTAATAQAGADKGQVQGQSQGQNQGQGQGHDQGKGEGQAKGQPNHGQVVSECNHRANSKQLKGQERKDYTEWCESRGPNFGYDDQRYSRERDCYSSAYERHLSGGTRTSFVDKCLQDTDSKYYGDGKSKDGKPEGQGRTTTKD